MTTDSLTPLYAWKALSHPDSFRVLILYPSTSKLDDIHITLDEVRLSDSRHYEALSYSWATEDGDDARSSAVHCDQKLLSVTKNCEAALRRLRIHLPRILWIDAICINQANIDERGHQVGLMRSIYKNAYSVPIYLGEPCPDVCKETGELISDVIMEFLSAFEVEIPGLYQMNGQQLINDSKHFRNLVLQVRAMYGDHPQLSPLIRGLRDMFARRWWQRIWVVQEASLAQSCKILWGEKSIWYVTLRFLHTFVGRSGDTTTIYEFNPVTNHLRTVQEDCNTSVGMISALNLARGLQASDPRDKIYGLIGIIDPNHSILPLPDYRRSSVEVFSLVTRNFIEKTKTLNILYYISELGTSCGPSWVVDWNLPAYVHESQFSRGAMCAAGTSEATFQTTDDEQRLIVTGKVIDEVDEVPLSHLGEMDVSRRLIECWRDICRLGLSMEGYLTGQYIKGVLGLMLSVGRKDYDDPDMEDCSRQFDELYELLVSEQSSLELASQIVLKQTANTVINFLVQSANHLLACTTRKKYLGLVPRKTQAGDKIALFSGGSLPFVLRPVNGYYKVVGGCYVHGIMKGGAWPEDEKDLEKIVLR